MKKKFILLPFLIIFAFSAIDAQKIKYSPETESKINQVENNLAGWAQTGSDDRWNIFDRMKKYHVNGVSIAVVHNYRIEWARGYGFADLSEKRPVTEQTLFQAASISKSLNSIGVLKLAEEKKIDCDSDINMYLKSWKFPYDDKSQGKKITVKELLSHTAGLTVHGFPGYERGKKIPSLIQVLNGRKPANTDAIRSFEEPGIHVSYSGGGTTILQLLVTDITGMPYTDYMQKIILDPLGMTSSCYCQPPDGISESLLATGYKADGTEVPGKYHVYPEKAAAGLWTNPTDLCKYIIETELSWKGESHKVLSPEMTRFRLTPVLEDAALGVFVNSRVSGSYKYFNHNGGNEGFLSTCYGCCDSGEGAVVMINSEDWTIIDEIVNSVATVYNWKDFYLPEIKKVITIPAELQTKYAGSYRMDTRRFEIVPYEDGLGIKNGGDTPWKLWFTTDSDFFTKETRGMATFRFSSDGNVTGFITNGMEARKVE
jgi:CubicO group peptidase (beta-lactamase class C family)